MPSEEQPISTNEQSIESTPMKPTSSIGTVHIPNAAVHLSEEWTIVRSRIEQRLSMFHQVFARPVVVIDDDHVQIHETAMVFEKPYVVHYKGDTYEFVRKVDGSIVVSEIRVD